MCVYMCACIYSSKDKQAAPAAFAINLSEANSSSSPSCSLFHLTLPVKSLHMIS